MNCSTPQEVNTGKTLPPRRLRRCTYGLVRMASIHVEFAGYAPATRRLLIAREVKDRGRFRRSFEELRLDDLALVRQASSPELLRDFGRWQDVAWRRDTLALH